MNWKDYELEVHNYLSKTYPNAKITHNATIIGRYSKVERQIDVLVEYYILGRKYILILDAKLYGEKLDVKDIETFISMVEDVDAMQGILITSKGYTPAAVNRAYYGPKQIELDILNFDELRTFQGFGAIPYAENYGVMLSAPFGWIIDANHTHSYLATCYQRGLTLEEAIINREWSYINIYKKTPKIQSVPDLIEHQRSYMDQEFESPVFEHQESIQRADGALTYLRKYVIKEYNQLEYTGFIEFEEFIFFCVLHTPEELSIKNKRKLEFILERAIPLSVNQDSITQDRIAEIDVLLLKSTDTTEIAELLITQGTLLEQLNKFTDADSKYTQSIDKLPSSYGAHKGKVNLALIDKSIAHELHVRVAATIALNPIEPTVYQDLTEIFYNQNKLMELEAILSDSLNDYKGNEEALGAINFYTALLLNERQDKRGAKAKLKKAKDHFSKALPNDHYVFENIKILLNK